MNNTNRIKRWFKRYDVQETKRKMQDWKITDEETFFLKVFHTTLTQEEKNLLSCIFILKNKN
jgi:hypothetical protein